MPKFKCSCHGHILKGDKRPISNIPCLGLEIYLLEDNKKEKLIGDVVLEGKELIKFKEWLK